MDGDASDRSNQALHNENLFTSQWGRAFRCMLWQMTTVPFLWLLMPQLQDTQAVYAQTELVSRPLNGDIALEEPGAETLPAITKPTSSDTPFSFSPQNEHSNFTNIDDALIRKGSVSFRKVPISEVVFMLSENWKVNIVAGQEISGEVSGTFHDAPLSEVLSAVLTANKYGYVRTGQSLIVLPIDQIGSEDPSFVSETLSLGATTEPALEAARLLLSPGGQLKPIGSGNVLVIDKPERVERVRQLFQAVDSQGGTFKKSNALPSVAVGPVIDTLPSPTPTIEGPGAADAFQSGIAYFTPQFTEAEPLVEALQQALGDSVTIAVFGTENRIMVLGTPDQLRLATDAIEHLDVPRPQVRIRALIYDVSLEELEKLGVDWSHSIGSSTLGADGLGRNGIAGSTGLGFTPSTTATNAFIGTSAVPLGAAAEGSNFVIRSLNNAASVSAFINALDSTKGAKLLADPTITVADRTEASIKIVQKIPIANTSQLGGTTTAVTSVTFEEAGITLNVLPHISRDSTISMQVKPEFSVLVGYQGGQPLIDSRTAETTVRVANGNTFVLGGLRQSTVTETVKGVPLLKDIKYVGRLFSSHNTNVRESELIVFLQPEIIDEYHQGTLREQKALCIGNEELDRIPVADSALFIPCCKDKSCPYHYPRPRVNAGSRSLDMIGDSGMDQAPSHEVIVEDRIIITDTGSTLPPVHVEPVPVRSSRAGT